MPCTVLDWYLKEPVWKKKYLNKSLCIFVPIHVFLKAGQLTKNSIAHVTGNHLYNTTIARRKVNIFWNVDITLNWLHFKGLLQVDRRKGKSKEEYHLFNFASYYYLVLWCCWWGHGVTTALPWCWHETNIKGHNIVYYKITDISLKSNKKLMNINRPGVAKAPVKHLCHSLNNWLSYWVIFFYLFFFYLFIFFFFLSFKTFTPKRFELESWRVSHFKCHVRRVIFISLIFRQSCKASLWRVCYQRG